MLYGRDDERRRVAELVDAARRGDGSGVLVLRGEAGIGKTALLEAAAAPDLRVLRVTGFEAESGIAFAGLNQLVWPLRDRLERLPAPQAGALRGALGLERAGPDRFTTGLALLTLLADLAEESPVLLLADDAQWLDTASAGALMFAARRLGAERVVMLLATRDDGLTGTGLPELALPRLPLDAARALLAEQGLAPALRDRVIAESDGNPLALLEFAAAAPCVPRGAKPLAVTERVLASFKAQIDALPEATRLMLLLAAAEGRGYMPSLLRAAETMGVGLADLEPAERARLVDVDGSSLSFRHPLIRNAAYAHAVSTQRIAAHQALADSADDADCGVRHRAAAATGPDEDVAADLVSTAERARSRGGHTTAASLLLSAAELTPAPAARAQRLLSAAETLLDTGSIDEADKAALNADLLAPGGTRATRVRAAAEFERGDAAAAARMLAALPTAHPDAATYGWIAGETAVIRRTAELLPDDLAVQGMALIAAGDHAAGLPLLRRLATEPGDRARALHAALIVGADETALDLATAQIEHDRRHGLIGALPTLLQSLAQVQIATGRHADAAAAIAEARTLARDTCLDRRARRLGAVEARIAAVEGDADRLHALTAGAPAPGGGFADHARALLLLGTGDHAAAAALLEEIADGPRRHALGAFPASADLVEAAVRLGDPGRARPAAARFAAWAEAGGQPWALAIAARNAALLADDEAPFVRAAGLHPATSRPFERARTELLHGEWLRRHRRRADARDPLRSALKTFASLRAAPWAERARAELRATGAPDAAPPAPGLLNQLTPQELQVVRLAAEGTSSREIAARLFLSPRTVEYHLYKAYPKLGVASRRELARLPLGS
ncbi:ATP-binding protein [Actinomadura parmotrematis]|uniref:LuxR C-terminal-related transcriptional regulator n=1 Tax=Actinomadura parmotrematis TaxID=2864039 RepID=A0ABS7FXP4_9ACTN|nr:LuxR family transcriptional regulator [Actinomadura parmotrematis]MBW8485204.1 LuxR C-terminal-related transcriptional regulator [Actinomadura parmotrematis]